MRVGINGMGRIGRLALRAALGAAERADDDPRAGNRLDVVHLNELKGGAAATAHLLEFDSVQGRWREPHRGRRRDGGCTSARTGSASSRTRTAADIPWGDLGVDLVLECTGKFLTPETLQGHLERGAKRVIVAAPVKVGDVLNIVVGINHDLYDPARHRIVTAASCTTNCLAPVVKVVHEALGIRHGQITTIHDPTNTNLMVDAPHKDLRRARSAMLSLAPTTTGSATAIALIYPELKGKLNGHAVRAPVLNASLTDCVFELQRATTAAEVNALFEAAATGPLAGILGYRAPALGQRRLRARHAQRDRRRAVHDGHRRHAAEGLRLVRQRDGLRLPHGRPGLPSARSRVYRPGHERRHAQLRDRHRRLLGLHAQRRRAAHAGAAALLPARLLAVHAGLPVPALRGDGRRRQPDRRLAGHALRHRAHAGRGPGHADRRLPAAVGAVTVLDRGDCRWPGWCWRRASAAWPRT